mgnify:FL=1|jgi:hypothetical protein
MNTTLFESDGRRRKVAIFPWVRDPEGAKRLFLRHNKPFNGHYDAWLAITGGIEIEDEDDMEATVIRVLLKEAGIYMKDILDIVDLKIALEADTPGSGFSLNHCYAVKIRNIDVKITLNEESIGYDWMREYVAIEHIDKEYKSSKLTSKLRELQ